MRPAARPLAGGQLVLQVLTLGGAPMLFGRFVAAPEAAAPAPQPVPPAEPAPQADLFAEPTAEPTAEPVPIEAPAAAEPAGPETAEERAPIDAVANEASEARETSAPATEPAATPPAEAPSAEAPAAPASGGGRRLPLRFVWQTDAAGLLVQVSGELAEAVGQRAADIIGENLVDLAERLGFDPDGRIARALAKRDTWSGVNVAWPTDFDDVAMVDLAGLPVFDRARTFQGYRGFGVCRALRPAPAAPPPADSKAEAAPPAAPAPPVEPAAKPGAGAKVVPLRAEPPEARKPALSPGERSAFNEIGRMLGAVPRAGEGGTGRIGAVLPETPRPAPEARKPDEPKEPKLADSKVEAPEAEAPETGVPEIDVPETEVSETEASGAAARAAGEPASEERGDEGGPQVPPEEPPQAAAQDLHEQDLREQDLHEQEPQEQDPHEAPAEPAPLAEPVPALQPEPEARPELVARMVASGERAVLERIPLGVLVYRADRVLFANPALLDWTGRRTAEEIERAGGIAALFGGEDLAGADSGGKALTIRGGSDALVPVEARLFSAPWHGDSAMVLVLRRIDNQADERIRMLEGALRTAEASARELHAILNTATDGVVLTDRDGRILGTNGAAEALFGYDGHELAGRSFGLLFAPESQRAAFDYIDGLLRGGVASVLNDGREVMGRVREGGLIPLFMTMGRINEDGTKFCAVFRDITQWKRAEDELVAARRAAERASSHKSDFLAKISHEIRTPLNAIIGFSEVMMEERFGPIGNPRYKEYLKDIHTSGEHVVSLVNDLLDLSKIEAGKLDLEFVSVDLNDVLAQCMALMQPQANRERIIIRTSLAPHLPPVVADARAMRQIVLNLLSNSIRFTQPGGQVILSTALSETGEVVVRVRDTGVGMNEADIAAALEPFRQINTSGRAGTRGDGTGLGLPLTKALVEANRATFGIRSGVNAGTMVEITFPPTRVLAE
ncbi:PAS domain S-box protein [Blastochloris sulfoviridis]|uniref:histidine kinase n=2 Tax=Blastochloris sulfoviridis TaxID=50712 RepID=A0A5M6HTL7_9HYPH|nr:PAS domain S-box protein [Blastochloris sulfoviridis]